MTNRLGRGLGALIPTASASPVVGAHLAQVPIAAIRPNPRQPRADFDEDALEELAASVRAVGLLQPVVVRQVPGEGPDGRYELVMGERRWRAAERAGLTEIPAVVRRTPDDALLRDALLENLHRQQLNPLEEAGAYAGLLEDFGATHEELAARVGKSRSHVTNTLRLLALPAAVQRRVAAGVLSAGHARALLALASPEEQERLASRIVAEGLSVRTVEEIVAVGARRGAPAGRRRPVQRGDGDADLSDLAGRLSERLDTRVTVGLGRRRGKIVVEFASREDLERIVSVLAPDCADAEPQPP